MTIACKVCGASTEVKMAPGGGRYAWQVMRLHWQYAHPVITEQS